MAHVEVAQKYIPLSKNPHLRPQDVAIWIRFLENNPDSFTRVWYDFRVGDPAEYTHECSKCAIDSWEDLTKWQIDVIGEDEKALYVIEIKPHARANALGQADCYATLFEEEQKPPKPVIPVVLTDFIISTTKKLADKWGVQMWLA